MCGISGYVGEGMDEGSFMHSLNRLSHRGPDGWGIWKEENIFLGHRRLAIIDLSETGKQPMEILDRFVISFNGEIYNYKELRTELELLGYVFKSKSDTEVLLYSFAHWGKAFLKKVNGMWAFGIWDKKEKTLFLSRDRIGKKPLFYSYVRNGFAFASEMKALYPFLNGTDINFDLLDEAKRNNFSYEITDRCLVKNISRFPAGSFGIYKDGKLVIEKFWNPLEERIAVPKNYRDQVEMFRELFFDACKIRMRSDVTVGTALSGGIDSSAVICAMNHISKTNSVDVDWQHAFVATFPGTVMDETEYAKSVTDLIDIKADFVEIDPIRELNELFYQSYMFEELYSAPTIPFVQLYRQMKNKNVKVSIDGHGADELFGGYAFDLTTALIDSLPNVFEFSQIAGTISNCYVQPQNNYFNNLKFALVNKYSFIRKLAKEPALQKKYADFDFLNSRLYESTYLNILPTLLRNYDRYSMINGVEIRMPFLDYRILQFAFSIPYTSKVRGGYTKAIVREALKGIIPEKVRTRKSKIGFNSPIDVWVKKKEFKEWLMDEMETADFRNSSTINPSETKNAITKLIEQREENPLSGGQLFEKIIPYIWEKGLKINQHV